MYLVSSICLAGVAYGESRLEDRCKADFSLFIHRDSALDYLYDTAKTDIGIVGFKPSSDAWVLFEDFVKRFTIVATIAEDDLRDLPSMAQTGGGNRHELAVALLNLFAWNGIETDLVTVYAEPRAEGDIVRVLVYVPGLDQVFDPTLPSARQHKGAGWSFLDVMPRIHEAYPFGRRVNECPDPDSYKFSIRGYNGKRNPDAAKAETVTPKPKQ